MATEQSSALGHLSLNELVRYGLRYVGWYSLFWLMLAVIFYFMPGWRSSGAGIAVSLGAAGATYSRFIKDKARLLSTQEYWDLVLLSTALNLILELLITLLFIGQLEGALSTGFWIGIFAFVAVVGLISHMLFYSGMVGNGHLKRVQKQKLRKKNNVPTPPK